jgi:hypothetical protein
VQEIDDRAKERMKEHADTKRRAYPSQVKVGDTVRENKASSPPNLILCFLKWYEKKEL